jgi:hypothetical protein
MKYEISYAWIWNWILRRFRRIEQALDRGVTCNYCRMKQLIWTVIFILPSPASSLPFIMFNSEFKMDTSDELQV